MTHEPVGRKDDIFRQKRLNIVEWGEGEVSLQRVFPSAMVYFYLNISNSGKNSQVKIRGVSIFKIRIAGGGKTGWGYLVLGYIPASLEIKTLAIEHSPPKKQVNGFCTIYWVMHIPQAGA